MGGGGGVRVWGGGVGEAEEGGEIEGVVEEEEEDAGSGGKDLMEREEYEVEDDDDDEVGGALDGIGWRERDAYHRLSKKSVDSVSMLSMLKVALIRATWMKDAKQFLMLSVLQKIVLGSVLGAVLPCD